MAAPWTAAVLRDDDERTYGDVVAKSIAKLPRIRPLAALGANQVVVPVCLGTQDDRRLRWQLHCLALTDGGVARRLETEHAGLVTALAATDDGRRLASADLEGNLYLWDMQAPERPQLLAGRGEVVLSLAFRPDGKMLVAGTAARRSPRQSALQVWDLTAGKIVRRAALSENVDACATSRDGRWFAYSGGPNSEVFVFRWDEEKPVVLRGTGRRIGRVAFAAAEPFYRVAFGAARPNRPMNQQGDLEETFDAERLAMGGPPAAADVLPPDWQSGGWTAQPQADGTLQLFRQGAPQGKVDIAAQVPGLQEGVPRCYCWLPDRQGKPFAIVVGTDVQNSIYVCRLSPRGDCPIVRHFRGHHDVVTSVGVSRDLRYLVSGAGDGTVRLWSLADCGDETTWGRWGAALAVRDNRLIAVDVHLAGPLFRKGLRADDVITAIHWVTDRVGQSEKRPAEILKQLQGGLPWATQVVFDYSRNGAAQPSFQLLPAWQQLATLFANTAGDWAFWTPEGYYDASMNGHRLFGWQVNRGLDRLPDYFRADQFYRELERPDVMRRLLASGNLTAALKQAAVAPKAPLHEVLPAQISATPRVKVLDPVAGTQVAENSAVVRALFEIPPGVEIVEARAYANGVAATNAKLLEDRQTEGGRVQIRTWDAPLPSEQRHLIQVFVTTSAPTGAFASVIVDRHVRPRTKPPQMHIIALGINEYGDSRIQTLKFPVADAKAVVATLRERSASLYTINEATVLDNTQVTRQAWSKALATLKARLQEQVEPDDLLVFFLAGHGIVDVREDKTQRYYYVGHDFQLDDLPRRAFSDCISWEDFRALADVSCRKLAILDTCHSGAIQPLRADGLKTAVRQLQSDVIFTITATTGDQRAAEKEEWRHGAFTKCLLEGLRGDADRSRDGVVTLDEAVAHVKAAVPKLFAEQTPTAAPDDLLPFAAIPLTRTTAPRSDAALR